MVVVIDSEKDSPEEIQKKLEAMAQQNNEKQAEKKRAAFGALKWEEDAVAYQKRLRDEWS